MKEMWPWITLMLLGVYHGLNPGMGWLFAVALGLQERSRRAVVRAFAPIALGHAASIAVVVALVAVLQTAVSPVYLRWIGGGMLIVFGLYKLLVPMSCPRWVGMRVGFRELTAWSFLMATACGAGLMVVPVILQLPADAKPVVQIVPAVETKPIATVTPNVVNKDAAQKGISNPAPTADPQAPACHVQVAQMATRRGAGPLAAGGAVLLHTLAMFLVMAVIAIVVYEKVGLSVLRKAWFNLDMLWAGALVGAGVLTFVL